MTLLSAIRDGKCRSVANNRRENANSLEATSTIVDLVPPCMVTACWRCKRIIILGLVFQNTNYARASDAVPCLWSLLAYLYHTLELRREINEHKLLHMSDDVSHI